MRHAVSDPPCQIRSALFAVRLVDYAIDVERTENGGRAIIGDDNFAVAAWRDEGMIYRRHRVFVPI